MLVKTHSANGIVSVELARPEARNALSRELIAELGAAIDRVAGDASARVLVLGGEGKSFCAGMDLKAVADDPVAMGEMLRALSRVSRAIRRLSIPSIARVQGAAIGGGCGLMVVSDFAVTHPEAKLGYPEVDLGICPAVVAPWLMKKIGAGAARAMLLAGGTMSGEEGFRRGLATHLVPEGELASAASSAIASSIEPSSSFSSRFVAASAFGPPFASLSASCLLYTSPSPRDLSTSRMPSSA